MISLLTSAVLIAGALATPAKRASNLESCLKADKDLHVFTPSSAEWANVSAPYNYRYTGRYIPAAVVQPTTYSAVSTAIKCGSAAGIHVSPRGGGHSYEAAALGNRNGSLVVDIQLLNSVSVDTTSGVAVVQAGTRLGDMALQIGNKGRALPHGVCPTVGTGGHLQGGGYGLDTREWGLALDHTIGAKVVLANGKLVTANAHTNSDLFWALRGGGGGYGLVVEWTLQTEVAPANIVYQLLNWYPRDVDAWNKIFLGYQDFSLNDTPSNWGTRFNIRNEGKGFPVTLQIEAMWIGDQASADAEAAKLYAVIGEPDEVILYQSYNWIDGLTKIGGQPSLNTSTFPHPTDNFYEASLMNPEDYPINEAASSAYYNFIVNSPQDEIDWFAQMELYGGKNSFFNTIPQDATAFAHRDTLWTWQFYASAKDRTQLPYPQQGYDFYASAKDRTQLPYPQQGYDFVNGMKQQFLDNMPGADFGAYPNYIDPRLDNWHEAYYEDAYTRLLSIKKIYDPTGLFTKRQIVGDLDDTAPGF
ncbi:Glucooligosaccharide oxidase [Atractiella rhizophila]|nr:Glucooligosaccharide oxidase [Atractiella rhizophila]